MRIRIALTTAIAVTCLTIASFMSFGSTTAASSPDLTRAPAVTHHVTKTSGAQLAALAMPVLVHTAKGLVIDVGDSQFPATPAPAAAPVAATPAATPVVAAPAAAPVAVAPVAVVNDDTSVDTGDWQCIRIHESGDNYNNPNMPSGAYGILISTWQSFGYSGWPYEAAPAVQDALALRLHSMYGFDPWSSRFACGL